MTHVLVIGRRRPGREIGKAVRETARRLAAAGWSVDQELVATKGQLRHGATRAVKDGAHAVITVGGETPIRVSVRPAALTVIVPAA